MTSSFNIHIRALLQSQHPTISCLRRFLYTSLIRHFVSLCFPLFPAAGFHVEAHQSQSSGHFNIFDTM